jgi:predicted O-methyltransferase YrrM
VERGVYINALYAKNDFNKKNYIEASGLKTFGTLVDDDVSRTLQLLAKISRPQKVLEIGTSIGYSTLSLAKAIQDYGGKIITIEYDSKSAQQAIKNLALQGLPWVAV